MGWEGEVRVLMNTLNSSLPCKQLNGENLYKITTQILKILHKIGFHVVIILSDNNSANKTMFLIMCDSTLKPFICHPTVPNDFLFLSFESVQLFKCI